MRRRLGVWLGLVFAGAAAGCTPRGGDECLPPQARPPTNADPQVCRSDPFEPGPFDVRRVELDACDDDNPRPVDLYLPVGEGPFAVVVFHHGFQNRIGFYNRLLTHLCSHGFVVVSPQLYPPGLAAFWGEPTAAEEAEVAAQMLDWVAARIESAAGVPVRVDLLGLAGHSRGGKVAWLVLSRDPSRARAIAGVDPVDGAGGPGGTQARVVQGGFSYAAPSLVIGTELGGACAPDGDNYLQFFGATPAPAWQVRMLDAGHGDMLDPRAARAAARVCPGGSDPQAVRRMTAGLLVAFFRLSLLDDAEAETWLVDPTLQPIAAEIERR